MTDNLEVEVRLQETITRAEWIRWRWVDVTEIEHTLRHYIKGVERPISEAVDAAAEWDAYHAEELSQND